MIYFTATDQRFAGVDFPVGSPVSLADLGPDDGGERGWQMLLRTGSVVGLWPADAAPAPDARAILASPGSAPVQSAPVAPAGFTRTWVAPDPEGELRRALEASAAFEARRAERLTGADRPAVAPDRTPAPPDPSRPWVRP